MSEYSWLRISFLLCVFGFLKEIRPSEPFIFEFLVGPWRNITAEDVNERIYPVGTYSYLAQSIVIFLITDLCKYKPLIICLALAGVITWGMLLWTQSLLQLQILEIFYGTFVATDVAYYTYIYAKVDSKWYQLVTAHIHAAVLAGKAISSILAQLLISFNLMNYRELNYITFSAMIGALLWSFFLPSVRKTIYFHQNEAIQEPLIKKLLKACNLIKAHFIESFSNKYVQKWSIWWSLSTCGFIQVVTYYQSLWYVIQDENDKSVFNGAVEAISTVLAFLGALLAGVLQIDWKIHGELFLSLTSLLSGFILLFTSQTQYIILSYLSYVLFCGLYQFVLTIASAELAKDLREETHGLIFGLNTFLAILFQSILTAFVVGNEPGFALRPRQQYFVYGMFYIGVAVIYITIGLSTWLCSKKEYKKACTIEDI